MEFFAWLEGSALPMWLKESSSIWPYDIFCLSFHAIGMALLVGVSAGVALRILGVAPNLPLAPMEELFPVMYTGFWINAVSGALLFMAYPVKAVGNLGFYIKMTGVVLAIMWIRRIRREVFGNPANLGTRPVSANGRNSAATLLFIWLVTITAGRLMAYHGIDKIEWQAPIAVAIVAGVLLAGYVAVHRLGWVEPSRSEPSRADS